MHHFDIVQKNIDNGYAVVVEWDDFKGKYKYYIEKANAKRDLQGIQPHKVI